MWPWRCGLMARPVSGVEWSGSEIITTGQWLWYSIRFTLSSRLTKPGQILVKIVCITDGAPAFKGVTMCTGNVCLFGKFGRFLAIFFGIISDAYNSV